MAQINPSIPALNEPNATADPKVRNALIAIRNEINGRLDSDNWVAGSIEEDNFSDELAKLLGINNGTVLGRDYAAVATSEGTTSSSYTDLATVGPSVTVTVPTNGFVMAYAEVTMVGPTTGTSVVGIYEATDHPSSIGVLLQVAGTTSTLKTVPGSATGNATVGGFLLIPATAGSRTYTLKYARVSGSSGTPTFSNRKLWVITGGA